MQLVQQIESGKASAEIHLGSSPMLGISVLQNADGTSGAVVNDVIANGKAAQAGLAAGDVITAFDGKKITRPTHSRASSTSTSPATRSPSPGPTSPAGNTPKPSN